VGLIVSGLIGFASSLLFAYILYWLDRYEKEPLLLLGGVFLWGAVVAAGSAFLINTTLGLGIYVFTGSNFATDLATGSLVAPLVEETLKGLAVLGVFLVFHSEFDSVMDGIIYAGVAALGFAATGFIIYMLRQHNGQKLFAWAMTLILGGALGNVIDRLVHGYVVDFLDFH